MGDGGRRAGVAGSGGGGAVGGDRVGGALGDVGGRVRVQGRRRGGLRQSVAHRHLRLVQRSRIQGLLRLRAAGVVAVAQRRVVTIALGRLPVAGDRRVFLLPRGRLLDRKSTRLNSSH